MNSDFECGLGCLGPLYMFQYFQELMICQALSLMVWDWSPYLGRCLSDCVWVWPVIFELRSWAHTECLHKTNTHTTKLSVVFLCHFGVCKFRFAYTLRVKCPHSLWGNIIFPYELKMIKKIRQIRLRSQSNVVHSFLWRLG